MPDRQDTRPPPEADARRDAAATALLSAPRMPAPPFSAAAEVSLAHMVVDYFGSEEIDPLLNCDIALRNRARAILAEAAPTSVGAASAPAARPDAAVIALANAASLEELTAGIRCNAAEDPPKGEDGPSFFDRSYDLLEQVTATRPSTLAGIAAKARVMLTHVGRGAASDQAHDLGSDHAVCTLALSVAHDAVRLDRGAGSGGTVAAQSDGEDAAIHVCAQELIKAFARLDRADRAGGGTAVGDEDPAELQAPVFALMEKLEDAEPTTWAGMALKCFVLAISEWFEVGYNDAPKDDSRNQKIARCFRDHALAGDLHPMLATGRALPASDGFETDTALRRAIEAHAAAHGAFAAATPAADEVHVAEVGGDASEEAMAPAVAVRDAANEAALEAWRDLFRHRVGSLDGLLPLLRHIRQHHADHAGIENEPDVFGYLVDSVFDLLRTGADHTPLTLSALSMQQLANLMDAFATGAHHWLAVESAPWARSENSQAVVDITDVEYDRQACLQTQVADEIRRRTPTGEWDPDTRLEALIRYEMRCNGDLRSAPELRAAIAQRWGAAA